MSEGIETLIGHARKNWTLYAEFHYLLTLNVVLFTAFSPDFHDKRDLTPCMKSEVMRYIYFFTSRGDALAYWRPICRHCF